MESSNGLEVSLSKVLVNTAECSTSPGKNPFDDVAKRAASFLIETTPVEDLMKSFKEENNYSLDNLVKSFQNFQLNQDNASPFKGPLGDFDIGRESIPFNLAVNEFEDAGRLSENLNSLSIEYGRESLGILNISRSTVRESLTLLDVPVYRLEAMLNASSNFKVEESTFSGNTPGTLDTAFLIAESSNVSLCNSLSFKKSRRLDSDKASPVLYSVQSPRLESKMQWTSRSNIHPLYMSPKPNDSNFSAELERLRLRIKSMSNITDTRNKRNIGEFWSVEKPKRKPSMRMSFAGQLSFSETQSISDEDNNFNDSVFLEANHIAEKISRCSQEELELRDNDNNLDNTLPPELVDDDTEESKNNKITQKPSAETIFKTIDKMVTPFSNQGDQKLKLRKISNVSNKNDLHENKNNMVAAEEKDQNLQEPSSKDNNLSTILSSRNENEEQNFISNFCAPSCLNRRIYFKSNNSFDFDDSGHSSIVEPEPDLNVQEQDNKHECYEVLDLRVSKNDESNEIKTSVSQTNIKPLDLSMKSKTNNPVNRRMSQSFTFASPKVKVLPDKFNNHSVKSSISSLENSKCSKTSSISLSSNDSKRNSSQTSLPALKLKKTEDRSCKLKKGPLKAVVPVPVPITTGTHPHKTNTKESNSTSSMTTPKKLRRTLSFMPRTSSPIIESKLKPVAQSTPDGSSGRLKSNSFSIYGRTPESRNVSSRASSGQSSLSNNINSKKIQTPPFSGNTPKSSIRKPSSIPNQYGKRLSVTEQKEANNMSERRRRSFSANKESGILSAINRVRENIVNSPYYKVNILSEGNDENVKNDSKLPLSNGKSKIGKLVSKPKPGKENVIC